MPLKEGMDLVQAFIGFSHYAARSRVPQREISFTMIDVNAGVIRKTTIRESKNHEGMWSVLFTRDQIKTEKTPRSFTLTVGFARAWSEERPAFDVSRFLEHRLDEDDFKKLKRFLSESSTPQIGMRYLP